MSRPGSAGRFRGAHPWLISGAVTVALLGAVEAGFRIARIGEPVPYDVITELDPVRLTRNRAGLSIRAGGREIRITTNRMGFRGRETNREKPSGVYRVAVAGDSSTFGLGVGDGETFCAVAERMLNSRGGPVRFEVLNAGVPGYGTTQGLRTLREVVLPLRPDVVVASFAVNDAGWRGAVINYVHRNRPDLLSLSPWVVFSHNLLWGNSEACRWYLRRNQDAGWEGRMSGLRDEAKRLGWEPGHADDYRRNLEEIVEVVRAGGAAVVFMPAPIRLKYTLCGFEAMYVVLEPRAARAPLQAVRRKIAGVIRRESRSAMWYAFAGLREFVRDQRGALEAYLAAMAESDPEADLRWDAYGNAGVMGEVAGKRNLPLVNVVPEFCRRELSDNPRDLWIDQYHPGRLGHRIIAGALAATIRDIAKW